MSGELTAMTGADDDALPQPRSVACCVSGPVAWIRLMRPQVLNAINDELIDDLAAALDAVEADPAIRVVIVTGTGRAFCAGADLTAIGTDSGADPERLVGFVRRVATVIDRMAGFSKPLIAAVNGLAVAGGLELVLACDLVVAAEEAVLGDAHANYGLLPGAGGAARLARVVGPTVAKYLALTGDCLPAADLVQLGLVNLVVPGAELADKAEALARRIAAHSPAGIAQMKRLIDDGLQQPLDGALRLEQVAMAAHAHSRDLQEGLAAFREKRVPRFDGR